MLTNSHPYQIHEMVARYVILKRTENIFFYASTTQTAAYRSYNKHHKRKFRPFLRALPGVADYAFGLRSVGPIDIF
tara:strand:+ start:4172 stop:4399 length:228 start_codon:yes stop_codon:yes gene_type:complete